MKNTQTDQQKNHFRRAASVESAGDRMTNKTTGVIAVLCAIVGLTVFLCLMLMISGAAVPSVSGFAVDSAGRLYVGVPQKISIYDAGTLTGSFSPRTSRAYAFTVNQDDTITLSTSTTVYRMDLDGTVLDTRDDPGADTFNQLRYHKTEFVSANGDVYRLSGRFGRTSIIKNGTDIIWQLDPLSYAVRLLLGVCAAAVAMLVIWVVYARKKCRGV